MKIEINKVICKDIGNILKKIRIKENRYVKEESDKETATLLWFYVTGICHDLKSLKGTIDSEDLRGWDYLTKKFRIIQDTNPDFFKPENIQNITVEELKQILPTMSYLEERVQLLKDMAKILIKKYDSSAVKLLDSSNGFVKELIKRIKEFEAYSDPLQKKTFVLLKFLVDSGLYKPKDPENIRMPIDYHMMRVALRTGIVLVDKDFANKLRNNQEITEEEHFEIRSACRNAYHTVSEQSDIDLLHLDEFVWNFGRNCCWMKPVCVNKCNLETCGLLGTMDFECNNKCILESVCLGNKDKEFRTLNEPNIKTIYY